MTKLKSILESRTVWANFVGLCAVILSSGGMSISPEAADKTIDAILQIVAGVSFVASTFFRIIATKKLSP
jgi:hypothetical protein